MANIQGAVVGMTLTQQTFSDDEASAMRRLFMEGPARLLGESDTPLNNSRELTRLFDLQVDSVTQKQMDWLWMYVSGGPADAPNTTAKSYVDNPQVQGKLWPGRWRLVSNTFSQKHRGVIQVLRLGWAQAIVWDEALLPATDDLALAEGYRTVQWRNCDPAYACAMAASLNVGTITNAVVQGQTLSGAWHVIKVTTGHMQDDGSCVITLALAQPQFTLIAYAKAGTTKETAVTYYWQVPKALAQGILDANKAAGASASCSYQNASGLVDIVIYGTVLASSNYLNALTAWCAAYREFTDYYWDLTVAERDAIVTTAPPQGWIYRYAWNLTGDALWDVRIEKRHDLDQVTTSVSQTAFDKTTVVRHTEAAAALPAPLPEVGKVKNNQNASTPSGNFATHEDVKEVIESKITFSSAITDTGTTVVEKGRNVATLPVLAAVTGADVHLDGDKNDAQKFDYHKTTVTSHIPLSCPGLLTWTTYGGGYWVYNKAYNSTAKRWYAVTGTWWRESQIHALQYFKTGAEAVAAMPGIKNTLAGAGYYVNHGSRPSKVGDNLWEIYIVIWRDYAEIVNADLGGIIWL